MIDMGEALRHYRAIWERKPVLSIIYDDLYDRITASCVPGATIEIGAASRLFQSAADEPLKIVPNERKPAQLQRSDHIAAHAARR